MKILKTVFLSIATILSLLVYLLLFSSIFGYIEKRDAKACNHKSINNFDVNVCRYRAGDEPIKLVSYDFNQERVITLTGLNSFDANQTAFLKTSLRESMGEAKNIERIEIVAHSTLMALNQKSQESELGYKRASQIKEMVKELGYNGVHISTSYSQDPFLDKVNLQLNGTLLNILELQSDIKSLKNELNISKNDTAYAVRKRFKKDATLLESHTQELAPYGSTVILISLKR